MNSIHYWDGIYRQEMAEGRARRHEAAWEAILPHLPERGHLLDVGCGTGEFLLWLAGRRPLLWMRGLDHSWEAIQSLQKRRSTDSKIYAFTGDAYKTGLLGRIVDVVYSGHLLEHLNDPVHALREQHRLLRPDGLLVVHFPYQDRPYIEHVHILDYDIVEAWAAKAGFRSFERLPVIAGEPTNDGVLLARKLSI